MARQTFQEPNFRNNIEKPTPNIYQDLEILLASITIGGFGLAGVNVFRTYQETFNQSIEFFKDGMVVGGLCGVAVGILYLYISKEIADRQYRRIMAKSPIADFFQKIH